MYTNCPTEIPAEGGSVDTDDSLTERWKRVLTSLELLLPRPVPRIDWATCLAANWRRHSFAGFMEPVAGADTIRLEDLLGIDRQKK